MSNPVEVDELSGSRSDRPPARPRVLFVDDDERLLAGIALRLRRSFEVVTANSAVDALARLDLANPFAAVVCDMRMPHNDGVIFLSAIRRVAPETTRMLLTGQADISSAIAAVNEGEIFRYLLKPIETPALTQALEQAVAHHYEIVARRKMSEDILREMINLLALPLHAIAPSLAAEASGRRQLVAHIAESVSPRDRWKAELACVAMHVALLEVAPELAVRWRSRTALAEKDRTRMEVALHTVIDILRRIPMAEDVCDALMILVPVAGRSANWRVPTTAPVAERILYLVMTLEAGKARGNSATEALQLIQRGAPNEDLPFIAALASAPIDWRDSRTPLLELIIGQRIVNEVRLANGLLFLPACHDVDNNTLEMIAGLDSESREKIMVYAVESPANELITA